MRVNICKFTITAIHYIFCLELVSTAVNIIASKLDQVRIKL